MLQTSDAYAPTLLFPSCVPTNLGSFCTPNSLFFFFLSNDLPTQPQVTMSSCNNLDGNFTVESDACQYTDESIISDYT